MVVVYGSQCVCVCVCVWVCVGVCECVLCCVVKSCVVLCIVSVSRLHDPLSPHSDRDRLDAGLSCD